MVVRSTGKPPGWGGIPLERREPGRSRRVAPRGQTNRRPSEAARAPNHPAGPAGSPAPAHAWARPRPRPAARVWAPPDTRGGSADRPGPQAGCEGRRALTWERPCSAWPQWRRRRQAGRGRQQRVPKKGEGWRGPGQAKRTLQPRVPKGDPQLLSPAGRRRVPERRAVEGAAGAGPGALTPLCSDVGCGWEHTKHPPAAERPPIRRPLRGAHQVHVDVTTPPLSARHPAGHRQPLARSGGAAPSQPSRCTQDGGAGGSGPGLSPDRSLSCARSPGWPSTLSPFPAPLTALPPSRPPARPGPRPPRRPGVRHPPAAVSSPARAGGLCVM